MIRRPPRSTRTDTLFPYSTLFRSVVIRLFLELADDISGVFVGPVGEHHHVVALVLEGLGLPGVDHQRAVDPGLFLETGMTVVPVSAVLPDLELIEVHARSDERRVGKGCFRTCRSRCPPFT